MDTSGAKIWLPGISDTTTLEAASTLCGTTTAREPGQDHHTRHPILTPDMIRQLPAGHALIVRGGYAPVIVRLPMGWKDSTYRAARHNGTSIARLAAIPEPVPLPAARRAPRPEIGLDPDFATLTPADIITGVDNGTRYPWDEEPS